MRVGVSVLLILCHVTTSWAGIDKSVCSPASAPVFPPPPAVTTSKLLGLRVEWRETITKRTYNVLEYYDEGRQLGSLLIQIPPQQNVKVIFDHNANVAMVMKLPTTQSDRTECHVQDISTRMFRYDGKPWLTSVMSLYRAMLDSMVSQFVTNSTVRTHRDYPVQEWEACLFFDVDLINLTTFLQIFFAGNPDTWLTPHLPPDQAILVYLKLHATQTLNKTRVEYRVEGDVTELTPFPIFPGDAFLTPPGVYCPGRPLGDPLPKIQDNFYMLIEKIELESITFDEIWYWQHAQKVRHDTKDMFGNDPNPLSTVYNFITGVRYVTDQYLGTCNIEAIQPGDVYTSLTSKGKIAMMNVSEVFHYHAASVQYVGEMEVRGVQCDVWVGVYYDMDSDVNTTVQWYFTKADWKEAVDTVVVPGSFFRMDVWQGGSTTPVIYNIHKYTPISQHWRTFDFGGCYNVYSKLHFVLKFDALDNLTMSSISQPYLYDMLQEELASLIFEEPNRFSNLLIEYDGGNSLFMTGIFLDRTPVHNYRLAKPLDQRPLAVAFSFLQERVDNGQLVLVTNIQGDPVRLRTRELLQINYPSEFTTRSTLPAPSTVFRTPGLPPVGPTIPTPPPPTPPRPVTYRQTTGSSRSTRTSNKSSTRPATTTRRPTTAPRSKPSTCPKCQCRKPVCSTVPSFVCPTRAPCPSSKANLKVCPSQAVVLASPQVGPGVSQGAMVGGVLGSLVLGALVCFLLLVLISRRRELPLLQHRHEDTETIPLGQY